MEQEKAAKCLGSRYLRDFSLKRHLADKKSSSKVHQIWNRLLTYLFVCLEVLVPALN